MARGPRRRTRTRALPTETALARIEEGVLEVVVDARATREGRVGRVVRLAGGWVIFGVGVVFVILPIIPGTPLVILAAFLLAPDVPLFARVLDWSKSRFSNVTTSLADYNDRFAEDFHRRFKS
jgi:hypothetical protein